MARSPAHKLGQIIGDQLEIAVRKPLQAIAQEFNLYLDFEHARPARGYKKKVAWRDSRSNTHDLDYVLEEGGSEHVLGNPRAFIETAWRRYTKHSRNKAQEIQGAIVPLSETHRNWNPFLGVVLAGVFTDGSLTQIRSHNFNLVYCPYETIIEAFAKEGVDIFTDEDTTEQELQGKVDACDRLSPRQRNHIADSILTLHSNQFDRFFDTLRRYLRRRVAYIYVLTLSGALQEFDCVADAVHYVSRYDHSAPVSDFVRYELNIRYSNGDEVKGQFQEKESAIEFLQSLEN